jgi:hypothetical protein
MVLPKALVLETGRFLDGTNIVSLKTILLKGGKEMGPDRIPIEVWKSLGDVAIV